MLDVKRLRILREVSQRGSFSAAAEALYLSQSAVSQPIARLDEAERELAAIAGLEGGELRLASFPSASATDLTEAVSVFHRRHPKVRLSVTDAEPQESLPQLRGGEVDLALAFDYATLPADEDRDLE